MLRVEFFLLVTIGLTALWFIGVWYKRASAAAASTTEDRKLRAGDGATGLVTLFFDTLGIGSFATTITIFRLFKRVPDDRIPGTLNVGNALPCAAQAFIFIAAVPVDSFTLLGMIVAATLGSIFGVRILQRLPRRTIQIIIGVALLIAGGLFVAKNLGIMPPGGEALGLSGPKLALAIAVSLVLGGLMMLGIGYYAPCLILLSLLGMSPLAAFPIMMGANLFPMLVGGASFIKSNQYDFRTALGITLGGLPGVLAAAFLVKSLPVDGLRWLVAIVVFYAAWSLLFSANSRRPTARGNPA
jgi:uncharacterized membrane protein YfcA